MPDVKSAELREETAANWSRLSYDDQGPVRRLEFVSSIRGNRINFLPGYDLHEVRRHFEQAIKKLTRAAQVEYQYESESPESRLIRALKDSKKFRSIRFGSDVAEQDDGLMHYFVSTPSYRKALAGEKCLLIGPKGSGKSAILHALTHHVGKQHSVVITPDVFATSQLGDFLTESNVIYDEDDAFVSTWVFTILIEMFKRVCDNPRGFQAKALQRIRKYLTANYDYKEADLLTRFIEYMKRIQAVKIGDYELAIKTRKLQELYALEDAYSLIPDLRKGLKEDILILIDELDQGWDNTPHSNRFIGSLLQAALKIQNMGVRAHVIVFVRSEIFDIIKGQVDQLDKLRSGIEELRWRDSQLLGLIFLRVAHSCRIPATDFDSTALRDVLAERYQGKPGIDYLISRTTHRPREVLQIVRHAHEIAVAEGRTIIDLASIIHAEEDFSNWKRDHLCSEYRHILPKLDDVLASFRRHGPLLTRPELVDLLEELQLMEDLELPGWVMASVPSVIQKLYDVEFLGVEKARSKRQFEDTLSRFEFAYQRPALNIKQEQTFLIHPAFWSTLELEPV